MIIHQGTTEAIPQVERLRIVSLVPSLTELLYDAGLGEQVVGVTKFCVHPAEARKTAKVVGGTKTIHLDRIAALAPSLIVTNYEENTKKIVEQCATLATTYVSRIATIKDMLGCFTEIAQLTGCIQLDDYRQQGTEMLSKLEARNAGRTRRAVYLIWQQPHMAAGSDTFITAMMRLHGYENAITATRYPDLTLDEIKALDVDEILLSSEPFPFQQHHADALSHELGIPCKVVDGEAYSWYGTRALRVMERLLTA